ncbi:hypothetical protein ACWF94_24155 [Streptomyces sp. NPDC055078]
MARKPYRVTGVVTSPNKPEKGATTVVMADSPEEAKAAGKRAIQKANPHGVVHVRDAVPPRP